MLSSMQPRWFLRTATFAAIAALVTAVAIGCGADSESTPGGSTTGGTNTGGTNTGGTNTGGNNTGASNTGGMNTGGGGQAAGGGNVGGQGGAAGESVQFSDLGIDAVAFDLARDNSDQVHIIWKAGSGPQQGLHYGQVVGGKVVGKEDIPDSNGALLRHTRPRIAVRPDGSQIHVSWTNNSRTELYHTWRSKNAWLKSRESIFVPTKGDAIALPVSGVDSTGVAHIVAVAWTDPSPKNSRILYWRRDLAGGWLEKEKVLWGPLNKDWRSPAMFTDTKGGIHASWRLFPATGRYVHAASGGSLVGKASIDVPSPPSVNHVGMGDIYVSPAGDVHLAYRCDQPGNDVAIWYVHKNKGQASFATPAERVGSVTTVEGVPEHNPWPAIGIDSSGRSLVAWSENPASTGTTISDVFLSKKDAAMWTMGTFDSDANMAQFSKPVIVVTSKSTLLVWRTSKAQPKLRLATFKYTQ